MSDKKVKPSKVKEQSAPQAVLQGYLDDMLFAVTSESEVKVEVKEAPESVVHEEPVIEEPVLENKVEVNTEVVETASVTETVLEPEPEPVVETPSMIAAPEAEVVQEVEESEAESPEPFLAKAGCPDWAENGFECLLFYVGGLKLAVPLVLLGGIHRIEKELTPLFGQPDWFLGLHSRSTMDGEQNIRVVHTSRWIMPEKNIEASEVKGHYVISLGRSEWGLLSHKLSDSVRLESDQVKWRTSLGKRPWLAGTVIDHMCAIIDVNTMVHMLEKSSDRRSL